MAPFDVPAWWPLALLPAAAWCALCWFEWRRVFRPWKEIRATPADLGLEYEELEFVAEDGCRLRGWWFECGSARGTILYCGGNSGNLGTRVQLAADLRRLGVNVLLFDYRGYGRSRGFPTEAGTYRDARAAFEVVRARYEDAERPPVVVYGQSLGAAVAAQLALDKPVRGLVLEGAFTSIRDMARHRYPWLPARWFSLFRYDLLARAPRLNMPKLFAHSGQDQTVPPDFARRLYEAAADPKQFVALAGPHGEPGWIATPSYWPALEAFVERVLGPRPPIARQ